jgi:hypothetical protein
VNVSNKKFTNSELNAQPCLMGHIANGEFWMVGRLWRQSADHPGDAAEFPLKRIHAVKPYRSAEKIHTHQSILDMLHQW